MDSILYASGNHINRILTPPLLPGELPNSFRYPFVGEDPIPWTPARAWFYFNGITVGGVEDRPVLLETPYLTFLIALVDAGWELIRELGVWTFLSPLSFTILTPVDMALGFKINSLCHWFIWSQIKDKNSPSAAITNFVYFPELLPLTGGRAQRIIANNQQLFLFDESIFETVINFLAMGRNEKFIDWLVSSRIVGPINANIRTPWNEGWTGGPTFRFRETTADPNTFITSHMPIVPNSGCVMSGLSLTNFIAAKLKPRLALSYGAGVDPVQLHWHDGSAVKIPTVLMYGEKLNNAITLEGTPCDEQADDPYAKFSGRIYDSITVMEPRPAGNRTTIDGNVFQNIMHEHPLCSLYLMEQEDFLGTCTQVDSCWSPELGYDGIIEPVLVG